MTRHGVQAGIFEKFQLKKLLANTHTPDMRVAKRRSQGRKSQALSNSLESSESL